MINQAIEANKSRVFFSAFPESPSPKVYGETAAQDGLARYQAMLGQKFALPQRSSGWQLSEEVSPYTGEPLKIEYPAESDTEAYLLKANQARGQWAAATADTRAQVLTDSLELIKQKFFDIAHATNHTTGQGFMMAFQASGPHAADRALEAIVTGLQAQQQFASSVLWEKPMGKLGIKVQKSFTPVGKGIAINIGCCTFPVWNTLPGMYAALVTGNPVVIKPHPTAILPIAIVVREVQEFFKSRGFDPHLVQLAIDTSSKPIALQLAESPLVAMVDFTGGSEFGKKLESLGKPTFLEKSGVNSVVIDSLPADPKPVYDNLAFALSLYSGQMCTAPQNFFVPESMIDSFKEGLTAAINELVNNPKAGPGVLGALASPATLMRIDQAKKSGATVVLDSKALPNPEFPKARTATPLVLLTSDASLYGKEWFGPICFIIPVPNGAQGVALAAQLAQQKGALSLGLYATDPTRKSQLAGSLAKGGATVSVNYVGPIWLNQSAAFSDFHGTSANPAANALFADGGFVTGRFGWQTIREVVS